MKCNQCGTEFDGKFCPECGAQNETVTPVTHQSNLSQSIPVQSGKAKEKKKPFFLRWWFILLAIIVVAVIVFNSKSGGEKIVWEDIILSVMLPEPPKNKGEIHTNSASDLWIDINNLSDKQFNDYVNACKEKGFTVDAESDSSHYSAYNSEGYKLSLSHYSSKDDMSINLDAPMEMDAITWPASAAGKQLPMPKSTVGKFSYEHDDNFFVYIGNTSRADYAEYVNSCSERGFNVDYSKGDDYYYADNNEGWSVDIRYVGNNVMSISIDAPEEVSTSGTIAPSTEPSKPIETEKASENVTADKGGIDPDFKAAMDAYEKFMNEYVAFMKKCKDNPSDLSLLADYADYISKYADYAEDFAKWEDEEMNAAEAAYLLEVQTRVNKKLLEIAY